MKTDIPDVVIVEEGLEAGLRLALADQPLLVGEEHARADEARVVPVAVFHARADQVQRVEHQRLQHADDQLVHVAEDDGARFHADLEVVVAIDHRVHGVVDGGPDDAGEKDDPCNARDLAESAP